jgi:hypothetical protein
MMIGLAITLLVTFVILILLCLVADWAVADFYFFRKWWSERP